MKALWDQGIREWLRKVCCGRAENSCKGVECKEELTLNSVS